MENYLLYEKSLADKREYFRTEILNSLLAELDRKKVLMFRLIFCSKGIGMTEIVENWIKRAGEICIALGFNELGNHLIQYARHEANHHKLIINDTKKLVKF